MNKISNITVSLFSFLFALQALAVEDGNSAKQFNLQGKMWLEKGKPDKAIASFELAMAELLKYYAEDDPLVASVQNNLGNAWQDAGELDKALEYYELALHSAVKYYAKGHPELALYYNNLGSV